MFIRIMNQWSNEPINHRLLGAHIDSKQRQIIKYNEQRRVDNTLSKSLHISLTFPHSLLSHLYHTYCRFPLRPLAGDSRCHKKIRKNVASQSDASDCYATKCATAHIVCHHMCAVKLEYTESIHIVCFFQFMCIQIHKISGMKFDLACIIRSL